MTKYAPIASKRSLHFVFVVALFFLGLIVTSNSFGQPPQNGSQAQYQPYRPQPNTISSPNPRLAANTLPNGQATSTNAPAATTDANKDAKIPVRNLLQIFHDGG